MLVFRRLISVPLVVFGLPAVGLAIWRLLDGWSGRLRLFGAIQFNARQGIDALFGLSAASAILGVLLLVSIYLASVLCWNDRRRLAATFAPLVRCISFGVALLGVLQMALAVLGFVLLMIAFVHILPLAPVLALVVGAFYTAEELARLSFGLSVPAVQLVNGLAVSRGDQPELWCRLDHVATRMGARPPDNVVVGMAPGFFATGGTVCLPDKQRLKGETLYVPITTLRLMSCGELDAVIGHELSHFVGEDTKFSLRFLPIYQRLFDALIVSHSLGGYSVLTALPGRVILREALLSFAGAERRIRRERELAADRAGAAAATAADLVNVLHRETLAMAIWPDFVSEVAAGISAGLLLGSPGDRVTALAVRNRGTARSAGAGAFATHPDLQARAAALGVAVADIGREPQESAFVILTNGAALEEKAEALLRDALVASGKARPPRDPNKPNYLEKKRLARVSQAEARRRRMATADPAS